MNLKGKVKSIRETPYKAVEKFGEVVKGDIYSNEELLFDEKGNITEKNIFNIESLEFKWIYKYDENEKKIEDKLFSSNGNLISRQTYKYDEKGNLIETNSLNDDGSLFGKLTYKYDKKGNRIESSWFNNDGNLDSKHTLKYDEKGNKIEKSRFNKDGILIGQWTYRYTYYDQKDNWTQRIEYEIENDIEKASVITERTIEYY